MYKHLPKNHGGDIKGMLAKGEMGYYKARLVLVEAGRITLKETDIMEY